MNRNEFEEKILDYLDGSLDAADRRLFEAALEENADLENLLNEYREIVMTENLIRGEEHTPSAGFEVKVMDRIRNKETGFFRRLSMEVRYRRVIMGSLGTLATLVLVLSVADVTRRQSTKAEFERVREAIQTSPEKENEQKRPEAGKAETDLRVAPTAPIAQAPGDAAGNVAQQMPPAATQSDRKLTEYKGIGVEGRISINSLLGAKAQENFSADAMSRTKTAHSDFEAGRYIVFSNDVYQQPVENREFYKTYGENPRISVTDEAVSTFSIDVDTGSYTNIRRFLRSGALPPTDAVRIEEFINYFDYDYPVQHEKPFSLSYEIAPSPLEKDRLLLKLGIKARDAIQEEKPWNLVFLVDVSGSMASEDKLGLVKKSLTLLAQKMRENDRIAIVTYAGEAGVLLDSTGRAEKQKILSAIDGLGAGGSTNGSGGITAAYEVAKAHFIQNGVNRVILATDGDFNVGVTSFDALIKMIEDKRASGVTLTTLGFGTGNIQEGSMEQLANKGNGNYFYIDSFDEARKVFETDLMGTIEVVAKDVKLQIEFNPAHVAQYRLIGYENRKLEKEDFNNDKIDAGEIGTGHTVTALYEVVLKDSPLAQKLMIDSRYQKVQENNEKSEKAVTLTGENQNELAFLKIRYKEPTGDTSSLLTFPIEKTKVKGDVSEASDDFRFAAAVSYFGHILRQSKYAGSYSLSDVVTLASQAMGKDAHGYRREFVELVKNARSIKGE